MSPVIRKFVLVMLIAGAAAGQQQGAGVGETPPDQAPTLDLMVPDEADQAGQDDLGNFPTPPQGTPPLYTQGATDPPADRLMEGVRQELQGRSAATDDNPVLGERAENRLTSFTYYLQVIGALAFVLFLIWLVAYLTRRVGRRSPFLGGSDYGQVVGRLMLAPGASLHFVEAAGRILVVGVTKDRVALVAEYDAAEFHGEEETPAHPALRPAAGHANGGNFLAQLQQSSRAYETPQEDDEIASLRGDIQRLQAYLREESRESQG